MNRRAGFTVLELMIAVVLSAIAISQLTILFDAVGTAQQDDLAQLELENTARQTIDRIAFSLMGADRASLAPDPLRPLHTDAIEFLSILGIEDGREVWSDPERIYLSPDGSEVLWRSFGATDVGEVVWCNVVMRNLEGETVNSLDDNNNSMIDEPGLTFHVEDRKVQVDLTVGRELSNGRLLTHSLTTEVTCRN